ncbi:hypothetical protein [Sutcliffiella deserti]|uniref:hypothetical protein n=1 Tax=Sutcliffiella deserti TaxID=2875501 RepID=UPI001CBF2BEB|nr:hypothetical protein [Sutcliffiella deserti]
MQSVLEGFLDRVKAKIHVLEILPMCSLNCCFRTEDESVYILISKERLEIVEWVAVPDVNLEGPKDLIFGILAGSTPLKNDKLVFRGSFRQWLLLDSLFILAKRE